MQFIFVYEDTRSAVIIDVTEEFVVHTGGVARMMSWLHLSLSLPLIESMKKSLTSMKVGLITHIRQSR